MKYQLNKENIITGIYFDIDKEIILETDINIGLDKFINGKLIRASKEELLNKENEIANAEKKAMLLNEKKARIKQLSEDIIQYIVGEHIPDIEDRKLEFITLHNEVRVLEGKKPRLFNNLSKK